MKKRGIITMTDGGRVTMPQQEVWMTCDEIADMLGLLYATVARNADDVDFRHPNKTQPECHSNDIRAAI